MNRSNETKLASIVKKIEGKFRAMFNKEFFGAYEAIIETVDHVNMTVNIKIPSLDNALIEDCRIVNLYVSSEGFVSIPYKSGMHIIVLFRAFSLKNPIVIGQVITRNDPKYTLSNDTITISNGGGSIVIDGSGNITLTGTTITANGEDLTVDDIGAL